MKLLKLTYRNFGSYGHRDQVITLPDEPSFFIVQGPNGAGKSTLPDVMQFLWYGKVEGKTQKDLVNRINKSAYVKGEGLIRGRHVIVERGLEPNLMQLTIDGVPYDKANAVVGPNDYLINELLEIPQYVFNNAICLSINDFKSFLKMAPKDKRALIDKIFGFHIINEMKEILSKLNMQVKKDLDNIDSQLTASMRSYENSIMEMDSLMLKMKSDNSEQVSTLEFQLKRFNDLMLVHTDKINTFLESESKHKKALSDLNYAIATAKNEVGRIRRQLQLFTENKQCPTCQADLGSDFHRGIKKDLEFQLVEMDESLKSLEKQYEAARNTETQLELQKRSFIEKGTTIKNNISQLQLQLGALTQVNISEQIKSIKNIVNTLEIDINSSKLDRQDKSQKSNWYKMLDEALGEKGIKQLAMQTLIPAFNAEIYKMMSEMHLNYQVIFDEQFDATISHLGEEISPSTLSTGESVKVDFVILVSFIRLLKLKFPSINIMFLDEIFASVDQDGIYVICKILRRVVKELGINIFVVAHNPLPTEEFEYKIDVKKSSGFSNLEMVKLI